MLVRRAGVMMALYLLAGGAPAAALDSAAIAQRPTWQKLLHMDKGGTFGPRQSAVTGDAFFLAENGRRDPIAELKATLAAFRKPATGKAGEHALCRFPGRALWLKQATNASWASEPDCPKWQAWREAHWGTGPISLIFVSGYMANPASFFGHIMLHIPNKKAGGEIGSSSATGEAYELLATSANFGADIPNNHDMVTYIISGLTGGYHAYFNHERFYNKTTLYKEHEMRRLWRYPMRLTKQQRRLLVAHLYELRDHKFPYRFLSENCASRLGRVLELAAGLERGRVVARDGWFVEPGAIVRRVAEIERGGQSLLAPPQPMHSRRAITEWRFANLDGAERRAAQAIWPSHPNFDLDRAAFQELEPESQARVLDMLLSHAAYLKQKTDRKGVREIERQLLQARLNLPAGSKLPPPPDGTPIHKVRPQARLKVGAFARPGGDWGSRFELRPLKLDLLESDTNRVPNAVLEAGKLSLEADRAGIRLHRLELARVTKLNAQAVPLPNTPRTSWSGSAGIAPTRLACTACRDAYARAKFGRATQLGSQTGFILAGGELRTTFNQAGWAAAVGQLGWLSHWRVGRRSLVTLTYREAFQGPAGRQLTGRLRLRQKLTKRSDLRLSAAGQAGPRAGELSLGVTRYF